jgi:DNA-binding beta-propeller fold protein YncE
MRPRVRSLVVLAGLMTVPAARADDPPVRRFADRYSGSVVAAVSADGRTAVFADGTGKVEAWDVPARAVRRTLRAAGPAPGAAAVSPDGGRVAVSYDGTLIRVWDAAAGTELPPLRPAGGDLHPVTHTLRFGPGGKLLAAYGQDNGFDATALWDVDAARLRWCHTLRGHPAVSPDGATVATFTDVRWLALVDAARGKESRRVPVPGAGHNGWVYLAGLCFSPDGRRIAVGYGEGAVVVLDPATQAVVCRADLNDGDRATRSRGGRMPSALGFTADGKHLLVGTGDGRADVWEIATGSRAARVADASTVTGVAVTPDGRRLVAVGPAGGAVYDLAPPPAAGPADWPAVWEQLRNADAEKARPAVWAVAADPAGAAAVLRANVRPVPALDPLRAAALIDALDAPGYAARQAAGRELQRAEDGAAGPLRAAAGTARSAEARRRIEELLARLDRPPGAEAVRRQRAVFALEAAGTPAAKRLLAEWAAGADGARLTEDARAALARLGRR